MRMHASIKFMIHSWKYKTHRPPFDYAKILFAEKHKQICMQIKVHKNDKRLDSKLKLRVGLDRTQEGSLTALMQEHPG